MNSNLNIYFCPYKMSQELVGVKGSYRPPGLGVRGR